jgi:hypothetical protein
LAAILLLVYLSNYRNSVKGSTEPVTVLVAKRLIPKGTTGTTIAKEGLYVVTTIPKGQLKVGAITDPAALTGQVTAAEINPSDQLTAASFTAVTVGALASQLSGAWRAVALPTLDAAHGLAPDVQAGDHVDVYGPTRRASPGHADPSDYRQHSAGIRRLHSARIGRESPEVRLHGRERHVLARLAACNRGKTDSFVFRDGLERVRLVRRTLGCSIRLELSFRSTPALTRRSCAQLCLRPPTSRLLAWSGASTRVG